MLGSLNSWSWLGASFPWCVLNKWVKCQSKSIAQQYWFGVTVFDLHVKMNKSGNIVPVSHNIPIAVTWDDIKQDLRFLNPRPDENIHLKVTMDGVTGKSYQKSVTAFKELIDELHNNAPRLNIISAISKWAYTESTKNEFPSLMHRSLSGECVIARLVYGRRAWAEEHNGYYLRKTGLELNKETEALMLDFVQFS